MKFLDYFFVLRPILFFPGWTTLLAGYLVYHNQPHIRNLILVIISFAAIMGGAFVLNQIEDVESDKKNKKLFIIAQGYIKQRNALIEAIVLFLLAFGISFYINISMGIAFVIFFLVTAIFYNYSPFKWKNKPILGLIANMLMGFIAFSFGWLINKEFSARLLISVSPYLFYNTAAYFNTTLPDIKGDRETGKITFGVKYGFSETITIALIFQTFSVFLALILRDLIILIPALAVFPFYLWEFFKKDVNTVLRTTKLSIFFFSVIIFFKFPLYFILELFLFIFTRFYYKRRFGIVYPSFKS
ncbi:MAG: UbiA prenyltransferase family protein [Fidelibacterota bacterium]